MNKVINIEIKRFEKEVQKIIEDKKIYFYDDENLIPKLPLKLSKEELVVLLRCNKHTLDIIENLQKETFTYDLHDMSIEQISLKYEIMHSLEDEIELSLPPENFKWVLDCTCFGLDHNNLSRKKLFTNKEVSILNGIEEKLLPKEQIIRKVTKNAKY